MRGTRMSPIPLVVLCLGLATTALPNPVALPEPTRIRTQEELRQELGGDSYKEYSRATSVLLGLWDGQRDIAMEALRSPHVRVSEAAIHCLARIGDEDALAALRGVLVDTSVSVGVRAEAATALSYIGDQDSVPAIESVVAELGAGIGPEGRSDDDSILMRLYQYSFEQSLERLRRPDLARPLLRKGEHFIRYRFLLDDIACISLVEDSFMSFPPELARPEQRRVHEFPASDYRRICDLLQDGLYDYPGMISEGEYLVIELVDGREVALIKNGETFCLSTSDHRWVDSFCVKASELAAYLDVALSADRDTSGGGAENRESSN